MTLFAFHPNGHGPLSFFVMAETIESAKAYVQIHIDKTYRDWSDEGLIKGWPEDYDIETAVEGFILEHNND